LLGGGEVHVADGHADASSAMVDKQPECTVRTLTGCCPDASAGGLLV